jgi:hypothetical protein
MKELKLSQCVYSSFSSSPYPQTHLPPTQERENVSTSACGEEGEEKEEEDGGEE